jgi:Spy/CpxP family protein refolding chaperone
VKTIAFVSLAALAVAASSALAQHHDHGARHHESNGQHSPYTGMQERSIKALSEQQITGLRDGRGLGMAMPAELNGYPGPLHVLELASSLKLTSEQTIQTKKLFAEMQSHAKAAGEEVIAAEAALDALFREKKATQEAMSSAVEHAALAQGKLRATHLRYHLAMMEILSTEQVAAYNKLRGY